MLNVSIPIKSHDQEILQLSRWYRCNFICHQCFAHKDTFMEAPARLDQRRRCSLEEFFRLSVKAGDQCLLFQLPAHLLCLIETHPTFAE